MAHNISCYRCGTSLSKLSLPLSRQDECPNCLVYLHVCRMCRHYDRSVPRQCREDGAEDVTDKTGVNFCDWFVPCENAFDALLKAEEDKARQALDSLFGGAADKPENGASGELSDAEKLFR